MATTICVWLSCGVIRPALRDIFQRVFAHTPDRKPVHLPGASHQWPNTDDK
jgi:hypothetical protein